MKIKLTTGFDADNHERVYEVVTLCDYLSTKVVLAGRKHADAALSLAEQIRVWCQLTQAEFDRLEAIRAGPGTSDYDTLIEKYMELFPKPEAVAEEAPTPKPDSRSAKASSTK